MPTKKPTSYKRGHYKRSTQQDAKSSKQLANEKARDDYDKANAEEKQVKVERAKLALQRERGELMSVEETEREIAEAAAAVRNWLGVFCNEVVTLLLPEANHVHHRKCVSEVKELLDKAMADIQRLAATPGNFLKKVQSRNRKFKSIDLQLEKALEEEQQKERRRR